VDLQREQIAAMKALGYDNLEIWIHYITLVFIIVLIGNVMGLLLGSWLGYLMSEFYMNFFRFPFLEYHVRPAVVIITTLVSIVAALSGTAFAIRRAASMPPAQAMRAAPPASYHMSLLEKLGLQHMLPQPVRMILRNIERHLLKSLLSIIGIAFACSLMMLGSFQDDAIERMVDVQFKLAQKEDLSVVFTEPASRRALYELAHLPGVRYAEPFRSVPVRLEFENHSYRTMIQGIASDARLHRPMGADLRPVGLSADGIVLTDYLGKILGVKPGDILTVKTLEGRQAERQVPVTGFVSEYIGTAAYMEIHGLNRLMQEGNTVSGVYLTADADYVADIYSALKEMPRVVGVTNRKSAIVSFHETMGEAMLFFTFIGTLLAGIVAFGVIYNNARIALSERSRELASLRILGFTQNEVAFLLIAELYILILVAIPLGFLIGNGLCHYLVASLQSEIWRLPLVIASDTYALAATVVLVSAGVSFLIIRWKIQRLDLIAELKSRE
jgi:putative ABC transport system permease protein